MKSILAPIPAIAKLLDPVRFDEKARYSNSTYALDVDCSDGRLLYSTFTGELVLLEADESIASCQKELVEKRYLVPEDLDEFALVQQIKQVAALLRLPIKAITSYTIFTTTDCNARCSYCYEHGIPKMTMSEQVALDVAGYIADHCGGKRVSIHWFGGEPLYNVSAIDLISHELSVRGVDFVSHMTSNGFYLDRDAAKRAKRDWHLEHVQITVDGTEDNYNRIKAFVDADGSSYQRVLSNIEHALDEGILVYVRLNMDQANADDLSLLVDRLSERFAGRPNLRALVVPLVPFAGGVHEFGSAGERAARFIEVYERLEASGFIAHEGLPQIVVLNRCRADHKGAEVILPDGQVARCEHFDSSERVGDIYSPWRDTAIVDSWSKPRALQELCTECVMWPLCVKLERCAWDFGDCSRAGLELGVYKLRKQILAQYGRYQEGAKNDV